MLCGLIPCDPLVAFDPDHPPLAVQLEGLFVALHPSVALAPLVIVLGLTDSETTGAPGDEVVDVDPPVEVLVVDVVVCPVLVVFEVAVEVLPFSSLVLITSPLLLTIFVTVLPVSGSVMVTVFSPVASSTVSVINLPSSDIVLTEPVELDLLSFKSTDSGIKRPAINISIVNPVVVIKLMVMIFFKIMTLKTPLYVFFHLVLLIV